MNKSIWEATADLPSFATLTQDESTDVLIVGGGMAGILCAYFLEKAGIPYLLCEANTVASGTTGKTTAVLSAQHDILYSDLIKKSGKEKAKLYLDANLEALEEFRRIAVPLDCNFEEKPSYMYSTDDAQLMEDEACALASIGFQAVLKNEIPLPIAVSAVVMYPNQAQFHPLKFLAGICAGLNIRQHTRITRIDGTAAYTQQYKITAKKIIVASHFPIMNTYGLYFAKLYQKRSYVIALDGAPQYDGTFVDNRENGMYFRNYENLLLIGGGDHRTGKQGGNFEELRRFAREHYPNCREKYAWATQDCMSLDGVPYIGHYSPRLPNVFVASGFNEWGMTTSMAAAKILTDMVLGKENKYAAVFAPSRGMLTNQLFLNMGTTILDFITPAKKRCPHLGCGLKWNPLEHSWDCPCHGSRFDENGKLLNNPATDDLSKR